MTATKTIATLAITLALGCASWGQQQNPAPATGQSSSKPASSNDGPLQPITIKPIQPDQPLYSDPNDQKDDATPTVPTVDRRPLSGTRSVDVQTPMVSSGGGGWERRGQLTSSFTFSENLTNSPEPAGIDGTYWKGQSTLAGNVRYMRNLGMNGGFAYSGVAYWNTYQQDPQQFQQIEYHQHFHTGRLGFDTSDTFGYSQVSGFGFGGLQGLNGAGFNPLTSNLGAFGLLPSGLNPGLLPNDSILTENAGRITNTSAVQMDYSFTARTSATFNGSYGLFHGLDNALIDSGLYNVGAGVNHMFNAHVSMSAQYSYGSFHFPGYDRDINNHTIGVSAAYRVNGRISIHGTGNVQLSDITDPSFEQKSTFGGGSAGFSYVRNATSVVFDYFRGITSGSGVMPGAGTDTVTLALSRSYHRLGYGITSGYARNRSLDTPLRVETEFAGFNVSHPVGRTFSLYASYSMQHQKNAAFCSIAVCDQGTLTHVFGLGVTFNPKPIQVF